MLKTMIKRDGTTEPFLPHKAHNWAIWAANLTKDRVDWSGVVLDAVAGFEETARTSELQNRLIEVLLTKKDWPHNLMAGRLFTSVQRKKIFGKTMMSVKMRISTLVDMGLMEAMPYSDEEWDIIETFIDHERDFRMAHFQIAQIVNKYGVQNRETKTKYETPQYVFMRMALALCVDEPANQRLALIKAFYEYFSSGKINAPTPNYVNLGTKLRGYASCCLYKSSDQAESIDIGDFIASKMTAISAGIGGVIDIRSPGDPIRGGAIVHKGKMDYFRSLGTAIKKNMQAGRSGACTTYYSVFDPEAMEICQVQNPRATEDKKIRSIHFAAMSNTFFAKAVRDNKEVFTFNCFTAPTLHKLFYSGDQAGFEAEYTRLLNDDSFKKNFINARALMLMILKQEHEVSTNYELLIDETNRHTPFKEPISCSNLCTEITQVTHAYSNIADLYLEEDHGRGEISVCSLGATNVSVEMSDEEYLEACYLSLKMIDKCIHLSEYPFPHLKYTARQRMNAGVGIIGMATVLARAGLKYSSQEGRDLIHRINERHAFFMISASLKLGKELGNAPWMHKTKWPEGWLPIDTYKKTVDECAAPIYHYPWEELRQQIIENKGIRNSSLIAHMPTESSSKANGPPNSVYPIRGLAMVKTDAAAVVDWVAIDSDLLADKYELAYNISTEDMIKAYAIIQKFTDQAISADRWENRVISPTLDSEYLLMTYLQRVKYGVKSAYYQNSLTPNDDEVTADGRGCGETGACTL